MLLTPLLLVLGGYLLGSIPTAFLVARWRRGIDIRQVGSGNVGGSNLRATVGLWATVAVGLFDIAKGALPVFLGESIGPGETTAIVAGLAAVVGHNWSIWLGFKGGRGIATSVGVLLVAFPAGLLWVLGLLLLGRFTHQVAPLNALGIVTLPLLSLALDEPALITQMNLALIVLMVVKRLEANQGFKPREREIWLNRLLHDRDQF
jgi:glycerol-3-phosphate acyltransferase PlsY